ncbi:hypothetical protein [Sphingobacterium faecium]|uniref:hypothetical protein n=1 Tax=Sphingobacterium faecium TaxID=34087 RepID=UPI0024683B77|nr:hypothetical protein [Sphingobacterium faecium]MDH5826278.1 hypothetical protein [Sphingobacterium faecium]
MIVILCLTSCKKESIPVVEEDPTSSLFLPDPAVTDQESTIRRAFFKEEKSYLLFNDTLRNEFLGVDYNGDRQYRTELLNMGYILAGTVEGSYTYTHELLQSIAEKQSAVDFMKTYVLPRLPEVLRPYSWFLTLSTEVIDPFGVPSYPVAIAGQRSVAVALGDLSLLSLDEKTELSTAILATTISYKSALLNTITDPFYAISETLYDTQFPLDNFTEEDNLEALQVRGFIIHNWLIEGFLLSYGAIPNRTKDFESYVKLIFNSTEAEVTAKYKNYPIVLQKYRLLKTIFVKQGYINQ